MKNDIPRIDENRLYRAPATKERVGHRIKTPEQILASEAAEKAQKQRYYAKAKLRRQKQEQEEKTGGIEQKQEGKTIDA